jgi:hypothetical protein
MISIHYKTTPGMAGFYLREFDLQEKADEFMATIRESGGEIVEWEEHDRGSIYAEVEAEEAAEEGETREFADLSPDEQAEVARLLFEAASHRCREWNTLAEIERILGRDIDIDVSEWAPAISDDQLVTGGTFSLETVAKEFKTI